MKISENKATKRKPTRKNSGRYMLNQSKEVLCICVQFQGFGGSIKEELKRNVYDIFIILVEILKHLKF